MIGEIIIKDANKIFNCNVMVPHRKRNAIDGRTAVSNYLRNTYGMTFQKIADAFGKTAGTIMHAVKLHDNLYKHNVDYRTKYDLLISVHDHSKLFCNTCVFQFNKN